MTVTRISTYNIQQTTLRDTSKAQTELNILQGQISSGFKADTFQGLNGQVEQFNALNATLAKTDQYIQNNNQSISRLTTTASALDQIIESATSLKNAILIRRNQAIGQNMAFGEQLNGYWQAISGQLNASYDGRYAFSGADTGQKAVNNEAFPVLNDDMQPNDGYYLGSNKDITSRIQDDFELTLNVRADDPAFQKIYAGLALAKKGHEAGSDEILQKAYDMVAAGLDETITIQASVNANKVTVSNTNDRLDSLKLYWKGVKDEIINTDLVTASTQVALNQGILQAAFQAFAKINGLHLSDYLR